MQMAETHYLPHEKLKGSNYPEVVKMATELELIQTFAMTVDQAVYMYNEGLQDKIDLDVVELRKNVDRCRTVCSTLGNAPNVCYDVLLEVREMQMNFQELLFASKRFGSEYIGVPSTVPEGEEGGIG
jgi:hypothetical protein